MTNLLFDHMESYARADSADDRRAIEKQVWDEFGVEGAVCIHDMSGFSRLTEKHGIVHYLSMVRHMQIVVRPIIERYEGTVVKYEADNCFAFFTDALRAVQSAIAVNIAFEAMNLMTAEDLNIYISTGIDWGEILLIENEDFYGKPVNTASKLGEDIGKGGDVLISKGAMGRISDEAGIRSEPFTAEISGVSIDARKVFY